jgi:Glycogen synthase
MSGPLSSVWLVTREYAGIAEAGGVKNVATSLAEGLARCGKTVTVFMPYYGFVDVGTSPLFSCEILVENTTHAADFSVHVQNGVKIILVGAVIYREKLAVYNYTDEEAGRIPGAARGKGYFDVDIMNMVLQKAVCAYAKKTGAAPDIVHCQDAHTALLPALVRNDPEASVRFSKTGFVVTIHNAGPGYRQTIPGLFRASWLIGLAEDVLAEGLFNGSVEPFLVAARYATLTTVSPWYADELCSHEYDSLTEGLSGEFERRGIRVTGITNGIDYARYEPTKTSSSLLPFPFDPSSGDLRGKYETREKFMDMIGDFPDKTEMTCFGTLDNAEHAVFYGYHGRIAWQKGLDVLEKSARIVLDHVPESRFVILGQGDPVLESLLIRMAARYAGRFVYIRGYERSLARMAVAVSDFLVLPSLFEPCGLEDFIGQIFGTIPVAHAVGGLQKIQHGKNGFLYHTQDENDVLALSKLLIDVAAPIVASIGEGCASVPEYLEMIRYASAVVRTECAWDSIIEKSWIPLYEKTISAS